MVLGSEDCDRWLGNDVIMGVWGGFSLICKIGNICEAQ